MLFTIAALISGGYAMAVGANRARALGVVAVLGGLIGLVVPLVPIAAAMIGFSAFGVARVDRAYRLSGE